MPIPRLYSAGELGSIYSFNYNAGGNVGECFAFGRIAGRNAAKEKPLNNRGQQSMWDPRCARLNRSGGALPTAYPPAPRAEFRYLDSRETRRIERHRFGACISLV